MELYLSIVCELEQWVTLSRKSHSSRREGGEGEVPKPRFAMNKYMLEALGVREKIQIKLTRLIV